MKAARLGLVLLLLVAGWRVWQRQAALTLAAQPGVANLERAIARDPDNPDLYMRLGRLERDAVTGRDHEEARRLMERAVALRPRSARFLAELGALYELMGLMPEAETALQRALDLNPRDAPYLWRLANLKLRLGAQEEAVAFFGEAMARDRKLADAGVAILLKAGTKAARVEELWPGGPGMAGRLLAHLLRHGARSGVEVEPAVLARQWTQALMDEPPPTPSQAASYLGYLVATERHVELRAAWISLQERYGLVDEEYSASTTALWNGDFERDLGSGPLAWRTRNAADWSIARAPASGPDGSTALAIDFRAVDVNFAGLQQQFVVTAASGYVLSAEIATRNLTGPEVYLELTNPTTRERLARLPLGAGTTAWHQATVRFGPLETGGLLRLTLRCDARRAPAALDGQLLLDKLAIRPLPNS